MDVESRMPGKVEEDAVIVERVNEGSRSDSSREQGRTAGTARTPGKVDDEAEAIQEEELLFLDSDDEEQAAALPEGARWGRTFVSLVILGALWMTYSALSALWDIYQGSYVLGLIGFAVFGAVVAFFGYSVRKEIIAAKEISAIGQLRNELGALDELAPISQAVRVLGPTVARLESAHPKAVKQFLAAVEQRTTAASYQQALENLVFEEADVAVDKVIGRQVKIAMLLVSVSPHPALDLLLLLWCGNRTIQKIAFLYGVPVSGISSVRLMKRLVSIAATSAVIEGVGSIVVQRVGESLKSNLGKVAVEATVAGMRMYKLGQLCKTELRPIVSLEKK